MPEKAPNLSDEDFRALLQARRGRTQLAEMLSTQLETPTGDIVFKRGIATAYSTDVALVRIHDLHLRATGQEGILPVEGELDVPAAQARFRVSVSSLMCQLEMSDASFAVALLARIAVVVKELESTAGLESVFLTSLAMAGESEASSSAVQEHLDAWNAVGWPSAIGAGLEFAGAYDRQAGFRKFQEKDLREFERTIERGDIQKQIRSQGERWAMSEKECRGYASMTGMAAGAIAGGVAGGIGGGVAAGPAGAIGGAGAGAVAGHSMGKDYAESWADVNCKDDKKDNNNNNGDGDGDPDDDDDDTEETESGCVAPYWNDFNGADPYGSLAVRTSEVAVPKGKGLEAFFLRSGGATFVSGLPKASMGSEGRLQLKAGGFLSSIASIQQATLKANSGVVGAGGIGEAGSILGGGGTLTRGGGLATGLASKGRLADAAAITRVLAKKSGEIVDPGFSPQRPPSGVDDRFIPSEASPGYRVEVVTHVTTATNEKGEEVTIETDEYTIYFGLGSALALIFGTSVSGYAAEALLSNPGLLAALEKGIPKNFTPSRQRILDTASTGGNFPSRE